MVDLSTFDLGTYTSGRALWVRTLWFFIGQPILQTRAMPMSGPRRWLLRKFGAKVGTGVYIRPGVRVKNPWMLTVGDYSMLGEDVWVDNLVPVVIGSHVCISQGAYLCTGNHDWSSPSFRYRLGEIAIEDGAWIGARAVVGPGVTVGRCAVLSLGSVALRSIPPFEIHIGNPAVFRKNRQFKREEAPSVKHPPVMRF
jgi:putative colanic acid biosynthesis acetyltransferase WcaF